MPDTTLPTYTAKDFTTDQDVRWCPGCGDYAVLTAVRKALPDMGHRKEDYVFVSGIGCAARFPYYINTYGMHSIHGRAPAFATGVKLTNPDLEVWIVSGDGDLLSIGGNHTMHIMRRNVDINIMLLNNRIYGLTKGQYSPTSEFGKKTKSTPIGSIDYPILPLSLAVGSGCTFVARGIDVDVKGLDPLMKAAANHRGTSFIEIYQDCNIFNHKAWIYASNKDTKADTMMLVEHGKPMIFGADANKGMRFNGGHLEVVEFGPGTGVTEDDLAHHDETDRNLAFNLSQLTYPEFPEPLGIIYRNSERESYDRLMHQQNQDALQKNGKGDLHALLHDGETWMVDDEE